MTDILELPSLVLDFNRRPVYYTNAKESICIILKNKAISILDRDCLVRSPNFSMSLPNVIISYYANYKPIVKFSKLNVIYRDNCVCQYCGKRLSTDKLTVDHIVPSSKFEIFLKDQKLQNKFLKVISSQKLPRCGSCWLNCITACQKCNVKKGDKYLWDTDLTLLNMPCVPKYTPKIIVSYQYAERNQWLTYLEKFNDGTFVRILN